MVNNIDLLNNVPLGGGVFDRLATRDQLLTAYVAKPGTMWYDQLWALDGGRNLFTSLEAARDALPSGGSSALNATDNWLTKALIYVAPGLYNPAASTGVRFQDNKSGLEIYFELGAELQATADLVAGNGLLQLEGRGMRLTGFPRLSNTSSTQNGVALMLGGSSGSFGDGAFAFVDNLVVPSDATTNDFLEGVRFRGSSRSVLRNARLFGFTGTTSIIRMLTGGGRAATNNRLINCTAIGRTNTGNTCVALNIEASSANGYIEGGVYATDGTNAAITLTSGGSTNSSGGWVFTGGGLAANTSAVGTDQPISTTNTTTFFIGNFYVKQVTGATAASLFSEANI